METLNNGRFIRLQKHSGVLLASLPVRFVYDHCARHDDSPESTVSQERVRPSQRYAIVEGTRAQWQNLLSDIEYYGGPQAPDCGSWGEGPAVRAAAKRILERVRAIVALFDADAPAAPVDAPAAPAVDADARELVEVEECDELPATCPQTAPAVRPTVYVNNTAPRPWELKALQETASVLETCEWFLCDTLRKALQCAETGRWQSVIFLRAANSLGGIRSTRCIELRRALCDSMGILRSEAETIARAVELRGAGVSPEWAAGEKEFILRELNVCIAKIVGEKAANRAALRAARGGR